MADKAGAQQNQPTSDAHKRPEREVVDPWLESVPDQVSPSEWWKKRAQLPFETEAYRSVTSLSYSPERTLKETMNVKRVIMEMLSPYLRPQVDLLEIGVGIGRFTNDLAGRVHSLTGIDASDAMLAVAQNTIHRSNVTLLQGEASHLNFPDQSFNIVFEVTVFQYIVDDHAFRSAFDEAKRALKPDGIMLLSDRLSFDGLRRQKHYLLVSRPMSDYEEAVAPLHIKEYRQHDGGYTTMLVGA